MDNTQTYGKNSIESKFHNEGNLFGVRFNEGYVFLEVTGWEQVKFAPHTEFGEVQSQDGIGFDRIENEDGDDILFVEKRSKKVLHAGVSHSPASLRRYTNYPEDENRLRGLQNIGAPKVGDDFGYVDGDDSPYGHPTDIEELYVVPGTHLNFAFYNPDQEAHQPVLNILMREYNIRPLEPNNSEDANMIRRIMAPGSPMPVAPAGSPDRQIRYDLTEYWGVNPISAKEARGLGN